MKEEIKKIKKKINTSELNQKIYCVEGYDFQVIVSRPNEYTASFSYVVPNKNSKDSDIIYYVGEFESKHPLEESFILYHVKFMLELMALRSKKRITTVIRDIQKAIKIKIDDNKN